MKKRIILSIIVVSLIVACGTKISELTDSLTKPLSPIELKVDSSTDTSVTLSWSAANTATSLVTTGYTIESATSEDFTKNSNKITETNTTATVKDLTKGLTYYFRVVANNGKTNLSSAPSNVVSHVVGESTDDGTPSNSSAAKPMLSDITIEKNSDDKIVISWKVAPGKDNDGNPEAITKYLIKIALNHQSELDSGTPIEVDASSQTSYVIPQPPAAGITYWASVQAVTNNSNAAFAKSDVIVKSYTEPMASIYPHAHKFTHNGHTYYVVNAPLTWADAFADAASNGGYLAEVNTQAEQDAIEAGIKAAIASGVVFDQKATDGGQARYLWLGGKDTPTEGTWVWDGNNDNVTTAIGMGQVDQHTGTNTWTPASSNVYENWGRGLAFNSNPGATPQQNEPDNANGDQNYAGIALDNWPVDNPFSPDLSNPTPTADGEGLGDAYQWNDIAGTNTMPYIVEVE